MTGFLTSRHIFYQFKHNYRLIESFVYVLTEKKSNRHSYLEACVPPTSEVIYMWLKVSSDRLGKQGIEPAIPGLKGEQFIHYVVVLFICLLLRINTPVNYSSVISG